MEKRTKRNGFQLGILMLCTVMLLFAVMPTGVLADEDGTETILSKAYDVLSEKTKHDVQLTEYYGEFDGQYWLIESGNQDTNVITWARNVLENAEIDGFEDVTISVDSSDNYDIIDENGKIHYDAVSEDDEDYWEDEEYGIGVECVVKLALSMNGISYDDDDTIEVTFMVPAHITSRKERLDQAYEYLMDSYLGHNPSKDKVTENLNLQNLQNDDTYKDYSIVSTWESTNKSVIKNDGTIIRPDYDKNVTLNLEMFYARNIVDEPTAGLLDPGPLDDCEIKESITVTVKGTLGEKEPEPEPKPEPEPEPEEPDPLPIIMFNSLTFDTNGGTAVSTVRSMQWSTIDLSSYTTEKEGYVFTGWYLDAECTKPCDKVTMDSNITVYAGWEKIAEFPYTDVTSDEWFFDDVRYVWDNGLIDGVTEDAFEPEANVTRAVLIEALWRVEGRPEAESAGLFTDVAEDNAFVGAIAWAKETGIANGYDDGRFGIDDVVTREQTAAFLYRYAQYKKMDVSVGEDTNILSFDDIDTASEYAIPALCWACGADILRGDGNGCLRPADTVTRAELSAQLNRLIEAAR